MCWSLYCGWPVPLISLWNPFFSSKNSVRLCVDRRIVDDQFLSFLCCILSFLRRTVYVYVLIVVLWMTSSSYFLVASFLFFEEQSRFMWWRCIVDDKFLLFPCGILSSLRRTVYVYVLIVVLWMTISTYFLAASFLFFEEQSTFMCWLLHCGWQVPLISLWHPVFSSKNSIRLCVDHCIVDDHFHLFPCGILSFLRRTVYVYVLIVALWMTSSSYFLVESFLFFEEQSTFMCWSLHCGWPVHLLSVWHLFFSSKNSLRLCVNRCIVDEKFLLFPCGILSFLRRTVYVYVLIVVLWMTCSSYFLAASFLLFEEQSTFMCWSLYCGWQFLLFPCGVLSFLRRTVYVYVLIVVLCMTSSSYFLVASVLFFEEQSTFMCWSLYCGWPVPLISLRHPFFSSKNSQRLCVDRCIVDDQFLLFSLGHPFFSSKNSLHLCVDRCIVDDQFLLFPCGILSFLRRTEYVYVLIVALWMTSSSYFLVASFLFFEEQSTFMCWSLYCGWPVPLISFRHPFFSSKNSQRLCVDRCIVDDQFLLFSLGHPFFSSKNSLRLCVDRCIVDDQFLLFPCGILSVLRRTVYVYVLIVALWMTSSSYFLVASCLFFDEQSMFMCWSLHCGWPVPLISLWHLSFLGRTVYVYLLIVVLWMTSSSYFLVEAFLSSKNSLRLCVDRCIVNDQFLLFPCGIFSFLRRTVHVYVLTVVLWMISSS